MKKVRRAPARAAAPPPAPSRRRRPAALASPLSPTPPVPQAVEQRNSVYHSGIVLAHALMSAGTTSDAFLRDNLEWLSRATNWAKFSATATLGVIHKGHVKQALQLLQPYLPQAGMSASAYSEGGALFALGIIHANHGTEIRSYLLDALRNAGTNEVVQHGAALGIGIAAMGTEDDALYEELKGVLFNDSAVAGEAAAIAMGLTMLGSASGKAVEEMLGYAHDTQHEKIIRGLSLALAMTMYAREEEAEALITTLLHDKDAILRYGAVHTVAFAYACTARTPRSAASSTSPSPTCPTTCAAPPSPRSASCWRGRRRRRRRW